MKYFFLLLVVGCCCLQGCLKIEDGPVTCKKVAAPSFTTTASGPFMNAGEVFKANVNNPISNYTYVWNGPNGYTTSGASVVIPITSTSMSGTYTLTGKDNETNCETEPNTFSIVVAEVVPSCGMLTDSYIPGDNNSTKYVNNQTATTYSDYYSLSWSLNNAAIVTIRFKQRPVEGLFYHVFDVSTPGALITGQAEIVYTTNTYTYVSTDGYLYVQKVGSTYKLLFCNVTMRSGSIYLHNSKANLSYN